jgi:hypothetical protein
VGLLAVEGQLLIGDGGELAQRQQGQPSSKRPRND